LLEKPKSVHFKVLVDGLCFSVLVVLFWLSNILWLKIVSLIRAIIAFKPQGFICFFFALPVRTLMLFQSFLRVGLLNRKERGVSQRLNRSTIARLHRVMVSVLSSSQLTTGHSAKPIDCFDTA